MPNTKQLLLCERLWRALEQGLEERLGRPWLAIGRPFVCTFSSAVGGYADDLSVNSTFPAARVNLRVGRLE